MGKDRSFFLPICALNILIGHGMQWKCFKHVYVSIKKTEGKKQFISQRTPGNPGNNFLSFQVMAALRLVV